MRTDLLAACGPKLKITHTLPKKRSDKYPPAQVNVSPNHLIGRGKFLVSVLTSDLKRLLNAILSFSSGSKEKWNRYFVVPFWGRLKSVLAVGSQWSKAFPMRC